MRNGLIFDPGLFVIVNFLAAMKPSCYRLKGRAGNYARPWEEFVKKLFLAVLLITSVSQVTAFAQGSQEVDNRVQNQDARVQQGVNNGTMTQGQANRIENKDQRIENRVNNGTESQRAANRQLNRQSRKIRREKQGN